MGWPFLSQGLAEKGRVLVLHAAFPHGRNQCHVLSVADAQHGPWLAGAFAGRFPLCRQRQPLPHAYSTAARYECRPEEVFQSPEAARRSLRAYPVAAAAELHQERGNLQSTGALPRQVAESLSA